ncbi:MAG: hypothetical protein NVSMB10_01400 [Steroidobacteraceae bacterium]
MTVAPLTKLLLASLAVAEIVAATLPSAAICVALVATDNDITLEAVGPPAGAAVVDSVSPPPPQADNQALKVSQAMIDDLFMCNILARPLSIAFNKGWNLHAESSA